MSSTNKTPNLELPQWVGTDPFCRADFNAAFAAIDAALAAQQSANRYQLLDTVTVQTAGALTLNIDVSGVDWAVYPQLLLRVSGGIGGPGYALLRFNNDAVNGRYKTRDSLGNEADQTHAGFIYSLASAAGTLYSTALITGGFARAQSNVERYGMGQVHRYWYVGGALSSMQLAVEHGGFQSGFTAKVYGLKF